MGVLRLTPQQFYAMTPGEYRAAVDGYELLRKREDIRAAQTIRLLVAHHKRTPGLKKVFKMITGIELADPTAAKNTDPTEGKRLLKRLAGKSDGFTPEQRGANLAQILRAARGNGN